MTITKTWEEPNAQILWGKDAEDSALDHPSQRRGTVVWRKEEERMSPKVMVRYFPKKENKKRVKHRDRKIHLRRSGELAIE